MAKYTFSFEYLVPEFTDITFEASNDEDAHTQALLEFEKNFPEAVDPEITHWSKD